MEQTYQRLEGTGDDNNAVTTHTRLPAAVAMVYSSKVAGPYKWYIYIYKFFHRDTLLHTANEVFLQYYLPIIMDNFEPCDNR